MLVCRDNSLNGSNLSEFCNQFEKFKKPWVGMARGIMPAPSLFVGAPGETEEDFNKTVRFILTHEKQIDIINLYPFMITPDAEYSLSQKKPNRNTLTRLNILIKVCKGMGIRVCVGTQNAEYLLFKRGYQNQFGQS